MKLAIRTPFLLARLAQENCALLPERLIIIGIIEVAN
jgi:hypothetical protein